MRLFFIAGFPKQSVFKLTELGKLKYNRQIVNHV